MIRTGGEPADPSRLRARITALGSEEPTAALRRAADAGHLFAGPTLTMAATGVVATLPLAGGLGPGPGRAGSGLGWVAEWLAEVGRAGDDGGPGTGPVAMGALDFEPGAPAELVVPRRVLTRDPAGSWWLTVMWGPHEDPDPGEGGDPDLGRRGGHEPPEAAEPPSSVGDPGWRDRVAALRAVPAPQEYRDAVADAVRRIADRGLDKVVLGRRLDLELAGPIAVAAALERLRGREPACTTFSYPVAGGRFLGASPELLVSRRGGSARCHPLAGTVALTGDPEGDRAAVARLRASGKDRGEHAVVVRAIVEALRASGGVVPEPGPPEIVRLRSVAHLATEVVARYRDGARAPDALELLAALHPTPAVGGFPTEVALQAIRQLEAAPRRSWAGPVGWVDHVGNGDWVIGIRSATVRGRRAWLWAGAGVVAESDPASELAETTVKLLPVADALLPGVDLEFLGRSEYRGSLPGV